MRGSATVMTAAWSANSDVGRSMPGPACAAGPFAIHRDRQSAGAIVRRYWRSLAFWACLPVLLPGCSGEKHPTTFKVTGVVLYQGRPVENATVCLSPLNPNG